MYTVNDRREVRIILSTTGEMVLFLSLLTNVCVRYITMCARILQYDCVRIVSFSKFVRAFFYRALPTVVNSNDDERNTMYVVMVDVRALYVKGARCHSLLS
jgi:hypothetical protein